MNKKILIPLSLIVIVVMAALSITLIVLHQGDGSSTETGTIGTSNDIPGTSNNGSDDEIDFGDLLNPDDGAQSPPVTSNPEESGPDASADPGIPNSTEGGDGGYSNGWY